jgi:signal transduction histidine kinase
MGMLAKEFKFRDVFLGQQIISSRSEYKRLMLTGYMSLICILVAITYSILDLFNNVYYAFPAYAILIFMPLLALVLLRLKKYTSAKVLLIFSSNLVVFWAAANDPFETGAFLFFIPAGIGSFAILAVEHYKIGFALATLTTFLFFLAYFGNLHLISAPPPSEEYVRISFIVNYFISMTISMLAVYFLMNLNRHSENELLEKQKLANQRNTELQKVNTELDRFVYSVSHDLRSPLSSILGLTNLASKTHDATELEHILEMIRGRVNAQDHFIKDIMDYARNARTEVVSEPVKLRPVVEEVINSLQFNSNAEKIAFRIQIPDNLVLTLDRIRLSIILSNLIGNSIKYHDLRKSEPFIEVGYTPEKSAIYVKDNGIGIMPEHHEKIFNMFYRGSDRSTGSGLGLFITKEAVTKLGGHIEVKSVYGDGSTFYVYTPLNKITTHAQIF